MAGDSRLQLPAVAALAAPVLLLPPQFQDADEIRYVAVARALSDNTEQRRQYISRGNMQRLVKRQKLAARHLVLLIEADKQACVVQGNNFEMCWWRFASGTDCAFLVASETVVSRMGSHRMP